MEIFAYRKRLTRNVIANEKSGEADCMVRASKPLLADCKYEVIVDRPEGIIVVEGTYAKVLGSLQSNEETRGAIPTLKEAAEKVEDPDRSLTRGLSDNQLVCLAHLSRCPMTIRQLSKAIYVSNKRVKKMTMDLRREGLIYRIRSEKGEYDRELRLSQIGRHLIGFLEDDRRFQAAQQKVFIP